MIPGGWFDGPLPRILAHRGLALEAPENSLAAFVAALDAGATHLETDVRATADGVAVLVHDPAVDGRAVADLPLAGLRGLLPALCTLEEALAALPDARFNLDVKHPAAVRPAAAAVRRANAEPRVLVTSFSPLRRRATARLLPGAATSAAADRVVGVALGVRLRSPGLIGLAARGMPVFQVPERVLGADLTTPWTFAALRDAGAEVHVWTVNDPARMRELVARGAAGIVTDRADRAAEALR